MRIKNLIRLLAEGSDKLFEKLAMGFLLAMIIIISLQVFTRYFLNFTPSWSEETALICMVWFSFLGLAMGVKRGIHLSIEYFVSLLPAGIQIQVKRLDDFLTGIFGAFLLIQGSRLVSFTSISTLPGTHLQTSVLYIMVPFSGLMIIFFSLVDFLYIENSHRKGDNS